MSISVLISIIPAHAWHVPAIIHEYECGTLRPDEYVVSLGNADLVAQSVLDSIALAANRVRLVLTKQQMFEGPNRTMAINHSSGDLLVTQDGDDLPHRQRLEIIRYFMDKTGALALSHSYYHKTEAPLQYTDLDAIRVVTPDELYRRFFPTGSIDECTSHTNAYGGGFGFDVAGGACAFQRELLEHARWRHYKYLDQDVTRTAAEGGIFLAPDYDFQMHALHKLKRSFVIDAKIYCYNYFKGRHQPPITSPADSKITWCESPPQPDVHEL